MRIPFGITFFSNADSARSYELILVVLTTEKSVYKVKNMKGSLYSDALGSYGLFKAAFYRVSLSFESPS